MLLANTYSTSDHLITTDVPRINTFWKLCRSKPSLIPAAPITTQHIFPTTYDPGSVPGKSQE